MRIRLHKLRKIIREELELSSLRSLVHEHVKSENNRLLTEEREPIAYEDSLKSSKFQVYRFDDTPSGTKLTYDPIAVNKGRWGVRQAIDNEVKDLKLDPKKRWLMPVYVDEIDTTQKMVSVENTVTEKSRAGLPSRKGALAIKIKDGANLTDWDSGFILVKLENGQNVWFLEMDLVAWGKPGVDFKTGSRDGKSTTADERKWYHERKKLLKDINDVYPYIESPDGDTVLFRGRGNDWETELEKVINKRTLRAVKLEMENIPGLVKPGTAVTNDDAEKWVKQNSDWEKESEDNYALDDLIVLKRIVTQSFRSKIKNKLNKARAALKDFDELYKDKNLEDYGFTK